MFFEVVIRYFSIGLAVGIRKLRKINSSTGINLETYGSLCALSFLIGAGRSLHIRARKVIRNSQKERKDFTPRRPSEPLKESFCALLESFENAEGRTSAFSDYARARKK